MAPHLPRLIVDLATVLGVAALTTLLFRRLKQPVVLGYLLAGLIVGPSVPVPLVADLGNVQTLAELGVILVMFSVGLEFDFRKLAREGLPAVVLGVFQAGLTTWLGYLGGRALGWGVQESTLLGAALAVSSTMIISKLFQDQGGGETFRGLVLSVGLLQDLYAILLLAGMDTSSAASGGIGWALARVGLFLIGLLGLGGLLLPPLLRWAADHGRDETLLVASVGACFSCAVLASKAGCSPALGAFGAGMLAATSRRVRPIERLVLPLRDMFGAIFFVAVGMLLDPRLLLHQAGSILALTALLLLGSTLGGTLGAAAAGLPLPKGFRVGLTLAQPGELSLVLVGVGSAANLIGPHSLPMVVGVTLLSAVLGPLLFRPGKALGEALERALPSRLKRSLDAIEGWTGPRPPQEATPEAPARPLAAQLLYLLLDALVFNLFLLAAFHYRHHPAALRHTALAVVLAGLPLAYLAWALFRRADRIAGLLLGMGDASHPRPGRMLRLVLLAGVTAPVGLLLPPLLPRAPMLALLAGFLVCLGILALSPVRRSPRIGAEWLLDQVQRPWGSASPLPPPVLAALMLKTGCPFCGRPLEDLRLALEELPGLDLVALRRNGQWLVCPPGFRLQAGDQVAVSGPSPSMEAAEQLLG